MSTQLAISAKAPPFFTSGGTSTEDVISDISYAIRSPFSSTPAIEAVGITTGENLFMGFLAAFKAAKRFEKGRAARDPDALFEAGIDFGRGVVQGIGGGCFLGYRATFIASLAMGIDASRKATTALGKTAYLLGTIGGIFFTGLYACTGVWGGFRLVRDWSFRTALKAHTSVVTQFEHLVERCGVETQDLKKQSQFVNACSEQSLQKINKGLKRGIRERLLSDDPIVKAQGVAEVKKIIAQVLRENKSRLICDGLLLLMGGLGVVVSVLSFFAVPPVLITVLSVLIALEMLCVDVIFLQAGWKGDEVGHYDKLFVVAAVLMLFTAFCVGVGVTVCFGLPLTSVIVAGIVMGLGVAVGVASYSQLQEKEKRWKQNHPQELREALAGPNPCEQFKKLPREIKDAFRAQLLKEKGELQFLGLCHWVLFQNDPKTKALLIRSVKKAAKRCWEMKDRLGSQKVMQMQALLDHTEKLEENRLAFYRAFRAVQTDRELAEILCEATWLVFTRDHAIRPLA